MGILFKVGDDILFHGFRDFHNQQMIVTDIPQSNHIFFENILKVNHVGEVLVKDTIIVPSERSLETHPFTVNCDTMSYEEGNSLPHAAFIDVDIPQSFSLTCCAFGCEEYCDVSFATIRKPGSRFREILSVSWSVDNLVDCESAGSQFSHLGPSKKTRRR